MPEGKATAKSPAREKTHPQVVRYTKGTAPVMALNVRGQTQRGAGVPEVASSASEEGVAVARAGFAVKMRVFMSCLFSCKLYIVGEESEDENRP
jgi:hypothetical protein